MKILKNLSKFILCFIFFKTLSAIEAFRPVDKENTLYRSAQPNANDYETLSSFGITTIINLRQDNSVEQSRIEVESHGMKFINLPLNTMSTKKDYDTTLANFLKIVDESKTTGDKVLIQCLHGKDRTGLIAALYKVLREGITPEAAFKEWRQFGLSDKWGVGIQEYYWERVGSLEARILADPVSYYENASLRLQKEGPNASFPEFEDSYRQLLSDLNEKWFLDIIESSDELKQKLEQVKGKLFHVNLEFSFQDELKYPYEQPFKGKFPYRPTIDAFEDAIELFDIVDRIRNKGKTEPLYHFDRYLYHRHRMMANNRVVIVPTFKPLGFNPLIRVRAVPIGFIGLSTQGLRVDRHFQTPLDFWYHDLNHVRRMVEYLFLVMRQNKIVTFKQEIEMYRRMDRFIQFTLMPHIEKISLKEDRERFAKRAMLRVLIFEILHESALPPTREAIINDLLRPPGVPQPFEVQLGEEPKNGFDNESLRTETGNLESGARKSGLNSSKPTHIHYIHDRALSLLANVYNKLQHGFFDSPEDPKNYVVPKEYRNPETILEATKQLFTMLDYKNYPDDKVLLGWIKAKNGSPEKFKYQGIDSTNPLDDNKVKPMTATDPMTVEQAINFMTELKGLKKVVTFIGFSALGYEHPEIVDELLIKKLHELDPMTHIINSGSTKEGISRVYELAKLMGFETTGLVATRALRFSGQFSDYVDHHVLFDVAEYGGKDNRGNLNPVSEAFVKVSDAIVVIGGNSYSSVILEEAVKNNVPVEYYQAEMNHDAAKRQALYKRKDLPKHFYGEAFDVWKTIASKRVKSFRVKSCFSLLR